MAFKDNIGMTEELTVEMIDHSKVTVEREWLEKLADQLEELRVSDLAYEVRERLK